MWQTGGVPKTLEFVTEDVQRRIKEAYDLELTPDQLMELTAEWLQLMGEAVHAVDVADHKASSGWTIDILTGEVHQMLTPEQEQTREHLRQAAKIAMQLLVNRYRKATHVTL